MKLKFSETNESHAFLVSDAVKYGTDAAAILNTIRYWLRKNYSEGRNIKNGYVWTYHTAGNLHKALPYLDERKCLRIMNKLKSAGAIIVDTLSENKWDRTRWYTLPEFEIEMETDSDAGNGENIDNSELSDCFSPISKNDTSNINNWQIDDQKLTDVTDLKTDLTTDLKTDLNTNRSPRSICSLAPSIENAFETVFWPVWEGRKIARGECLAIFSDIALHKSDPQQFAQELVADIQRRRGTGQHGFDKIHPKSYLKGRLWEGGPPTSAPTPSSPRKANALDFSCWPTQPSKQVLDDWNLIRNKKRAPLTQTAVDRLRPKLELAQQRLNLTVDDVLGICVERGWQSFEVDWLEKHINAGGLPVSSSPPLGRQSALEARSRSAIEQWLDKSGNTYDHEG